MVFQKGKTNNLQEKLALLFIVLGWGKEATGAKNST